MASTSIPNHPPIEQTPTETSKTPPSMNTADLVPIDLPTAPINTTTMTQSPTNSTTLSPPITPLDPYETKIRQIYESDKAFSHVNTRSTILPHQITQIRNLFKIPLQYDLRIPALNERMYWRPEKEWVVIPLWALKYGVRFPLHEFISSFLSLAGIGFAQLVPNSYLHLVSFIAACHEHRITPGLDFFFALYSLGRTREPRLQQLNKNPRKTTCIKTPSSNKGWHSQWIFVKGTNLTLLPNWAEPEDPIIKVSRFPRNRVDEFKTFYQKLKSIEWPLDVLFDPVLPSF